MRVFRRLIKPAALMSVGAAAAYLYDPQRGRARRTKLTDQTRSKLRRVAERSEANARYFEGKAEGAAAIAEGKGTFTPKDDRSVADNVRQVLSGLPFDTTKVTIDAVDGTVSLRGELQTPEEIREAKDAVAGSPGVDTVESWLHLPGTDAPNKAAAIAASPNAR